MDLVGFLNTLGDFMSNMAGISVKTLTLWNMNGSGQFILSLVDVESWLSEPEMFLDLLRRLV